MSASASASAYSLHLFIKKLDAYEPGLSRQHIIPIVQEKLDNEWYAEQYRWDFRYDIYKLRKEYLELCKEWEADNQYDWTVFDDAKSKEEDLYFTCSGAHVLTREQFDIEYPEGCFAEEYPSRALLSGIIDSRPSLPIGEGPRCCCGCGAAPVPPNLSFN